MSVEIFLTASPVPFREFHEDMLTPRLYSTLITASAPTPAANFRNCMLTSASLGDLVKAERDSDFASKSRMGSYSKPGLPTWISIWSMFTGSSNKDLGKVANHSWAGKGRPRSRAHVQEQSRIPAQDDVQRMMNAGTATGLASVARYIACIAPVGQEYEVVNVGWYNLGYRQVEVVLHDQRSSGHTNEGCQGWTRTDLVDRPN